LVHPIAYRSQALLQSAGLLLSNRFRAVFIAQQRTFELGEDVIRDVNIFQDLAQPLADFFLAEVRQLTRAAIPSTPVICVAIFFDFSRYSAVVVRAVEHPGKCKMMLSIFRPVMTLENILDLLEELPGNKRIMRPFVGLALPNKKPSVKWIFERFLQMPFRIDTAKFRSYCFAQR
jgi:hypothetical protein